MLNRSTAAAAMASLLLLVPRNLAAAATMSSDNDNKNLRGRPIGVTLIDQAATLEDGGNSDGPSSTFGFGFGRVLQNMLNSSDKQFTEDLDVHYPLFLTSNEPEKDDYHVNDILFSFTLTAPSSNVLRQPPSRKLGEAATAEGDEEHGDGHDLVVHVTYEQIYAIMVFLITATALGIVTSKLGMVS